MAAHDFKVKKGGYLGWGGHVLSRDGEWGEGKRNERSHALWHP